MWSSRDNRQVFTKSWVVPNLQIDLSVSPSSGQIGTTFVATATISAGQNAPDDYSFSGALTFNAGGIIFQQNIGGLIYSKHYYDYWKITDYSIKPIFSATGFTFPSKGNYQVTAQYTDSITNISANAVTVSMVDQYEPILNDIQNELLNTKNDLENVSNELMQTIVELENVHGELNQTSADLAKTKTQLEKTKSDLNDTNAALNLVKLDLDNTKRQLANTNTNLNDTEERLTTTKKELNDNIQNAKQFAYAGIALGIIGMIIGMVGIIMARRPKTVVAPAVSTPPQYAPSPTPPVPIIQHVAPSQPPLQQQYIPPLAPQQPAKTAQAPPQIPAGVCGKCGSPVAAGMKFCGVCGSPR